MLMEVVKRSLTYVGLQGHLAIHKLLRELLVRRTRLRNDLYCVEWDVKLYYTYNYLVRRTSGASGARVLPAVPLSYVDIAYRNSCGQNCQ